MYRLANHWKCSVSDLRLSAQELTRWMVWMDAEQIGPAWDRLRHAELMAAISNSGRIEHREGRLFTPADYLRADPWAPAPVAIPQTAAQIAAELEAMAHLFPGG